MVELGKVAVNGQLDGRADVGREKSTPRKHLGSDEGWAQEEALPHHRLVEHHLPLVHRLSKRFGSCGEPLEDLVQIGTIGLIKALEKFDPARGFKFVTYAVPVIVGEIKNHLRDHGWAVKIPRKLQRHNLAVKRAVDSLTQELGRAPTVQQIAEATCLTQEEVFDTFELGHYGRPLSLDVEYNGDGSKDVSTLADYLGYEDPEFNLLSNRIDLNKALTCLSPRERTIIYMKFYRGLSQTNIAKRLGISQMHVSRLQRHALGKLRNGLVR